MGVQTHHVIIVHGNSEEIKALHGFAVDLFKIDDFEPDDFEPQMISPILEGYNLTKTFFIGPDASKEGWPESDYYDERRRLFKEHVESSQFSDGSNMVYYTEVITTDQLEGKEPRVISHNYRKVIDGNDK